MHRLGFRLTPTQLNMTLKHCTAVVSLLFMLACTNRGQLSGQDSPPDAAAGNDSSQAAEANTAPIGALTPPIEIVEAAEFSDGGTTYVKLKDAKHRELVFCVSEAAFAEVIPADAIFFDATHPTAAGARLPVSRAEVRAALTALETALDAVFPKDGRDKFKKWGDPLEHFWHEHAAKPVDQQRSDDQWKHIFAFDALRRMKSQESPPLLPAGGPKPDWYDEYDADRRERIAEEQRVRNEDKRFKGFYPQNARVLFSLSGVEGYPSDEAIAAQGAELAAAVGDPVKLAVATCRALGILKNSWNTFTLRDQIAVQAMLTVGADDFAGALPKLADDKSALLGAGRIFYYFRYGAKLSESEWNRWAPPITKALLSHGVDDNKSQAVMMLSGARHAGATPLLRRIARGEIGVEPDLSDQWHDEPGLKASAYLGLAARDDETVRDEIRAALESATLPQNRAALEVASALLGEPVYLTDKNMKLDSTFIGHAMLRAIERFDGKHGMDVLMTAGLDHNYASVSNKAIKTAERITGQKWIPDDTQFQPARYADDAKAWWAEHGEGFQPQRRTSQ